MGRVTRHLEQMDCADVARVRRATRHEHATAERGQRRETADKVTLTTH